MSFRVFIEEMSEGASALSSDGTVLFCNKRFAELLNTSTGQIIGKHFDLFLYSEDRSKFRKLLQMGLIRKGQETLRCMRFGDSSPIQLHLSVNPFLAGGLEENVCLIASDLSGVHNVEEELHRKQKFSEQRIAEFTTVLNRANEELVHSRIAYLNMMQDSVEANDTLKISNKKLVRQSKKRRKAEKTVEEIGKDVSYAFKRFA